MNSPCMLLSLHRKDTSAAIIIQISVTAKQNNTNFRSHTWEKSTVERSSNSRTAEERGTRTCSSFDANTSSIRPSFLITLDRVLGTVAFRLKIRLSIIQDSFYPKLKSENSVFYSVPFFFRHRQHAYDLYSVDDPAPAHI